MTYSRRLNFYNYQIISDSVQVPGPVVGIEGKSTGHWWQEWSGFLHFNPHIRR
jgi:hypothetical protein